MHCTKDREFVVRHNSTLPGSPARFISEVTYAEYSRRCVRRGEIAVLLRQVIEVAERHNLGACLDIKQMLPGAVVDLVDKIKDTGYLHKVVAASFRTDLAAAAKAASPELATSVLFHDPNADLDSLVEGVVCDFLHPCFDIFPQPLRYFTQQWVERLKQAGAGLVAWHITTPAMAAAVIAAGVNGACADASRIIAAEIATRRGDPPDAGNDLTDPETAAAMRERPW